MKKRIFALGTAAAMMAAIPQLYAQDAEVKVEADVPKSERKADLDRSDIDADVEVKKSDRQVKNTDKASGILGMEVRNSDNQKLGEIKDLVMDMDSGKVSYAVLAVGGFLGIGEKLIALPPGTLKVSDDSKYLLLEADKSKIQAAPGFAATAWPQPGDPEIDRFWSDVRATGAPAAGETRKSADIDVDVDKSSKKKIYTDADKDKKVEVDVDKE